MLKAMIGPVWTVSGVGRFYVDRRRAGEERWFLGKPEDARMRIPDDLLTMPIFLGGRDSSGNLHYRATAFLVATPTSRNRVGWPCLVTARHNVEHALREYGNVCIRLNSREGGAADVEIRESWLYPENPGSDIAAMPFPFQSFGETAGEYAWEPLPAPTRWFVTNEVIASRGIGIGEDLIVMGLFSSHLGRTRNLPIVRSGNIASMPLEPLVDQDTGDEYNAYLAEVRSVGGLSGSPVFVVLNPATRVHPEDYDKEIGGQVFYLLGLVRGHWNRRAERDFLETERERLNTGIAIVTPITDLLPVLEMEEFVRYRKEMDKYWDENQPDEQVKDSAAPDSQGAEFGRFEDLTDKLLKVPKKELDEKRREES
jgi:hypothetical protein